MFDLNDYQDQADRTRAHDLSEKDSLAVMALGLAGESGEVADHIKKWLGHGHEMNVGYLADELGDVLWYVACLARELDLSLGFVATRNIEKLQRRYPDGFSSERSINRPDPWQQQMVDRIDDAIWCNGPHWSFMSTLPFSQLAGLEDLGDLFNNMSGEELDEEYERWGIDCE